MAIKKNQSKALESMQMALETESKGKAEALRMKKKLETDVSDLDLALEHANAGALETQGTIKKYQNQVRDAQVKVDEESQMKAVAQDAKVNADRKAGAMQNSLEEGRTMLEQADRGRRSLEQEHADSNETLADLTNQNQAISAAKRKLEKDRKLLEAQCKDAQSRADEAEVNALKGGKKAMMKMETRIRELESEMDAESRRFGDSSKNLRKTERKIN